MDKMERKKTLDTSPKDNAMEQSRKGTENQKSGCNNRGRYTQVGLSK